MHNQKTKADWYLFIENAGRLFADTGLILKSADVNQMGTYWEANGM